MSGRVIFLKSK